MKSFDDETKKIDPDSDNKARLPRSITREQRSRLLREVDENSRIQSGIDLLNSLGGVGEVLDKSHPFSKLINKVVSKFIDDENHDLSVAVDTEDDGIAFFGPKARKVVIGKGVLRLLVKNGLEIAEDHIAALVAHELVHSERNKNLGRISNKEEQEESIKYQAAGHNQEHEADRKAMLMLANVGYNPNAIIDLLSYLNPEFLTYQGASHPALLNRINHLKRILVDDDQPLTNTGKKLTLIDHETALWIKTESTEVYKETNECLVLSVSELEEKLKSSTNLAEYVHTLRFYEHAKKVAYAKEVINSGNIEAILPKAMVLQALLPPHASQIWEDKLHEGLDFIEGDIAQLRDKLVSVLGKGFISKQDDTSLSFPRFKVAEKYHLSVQSISENSYFNTDDIKVDSINNELDELFIRFKKQSPFFGERRKQTLEEIIQEVKTENFSVPDSVLNNIPELFNYLVDHEDELKKQERQYYYLKNKILAYILAPHYEETFYSNTFDPLILQTYYPKRVRSHVKNTFQERNKKKKKEGLAYETDERIESQVTEIYDLHENFDEYTRGCVFEAALKLAPSEDLPTELLEPLIEILDSEYAIPPNKSILFLNNLMHNRYYFRGHEYGAIFEGIDTLNKQELINLAKFCQSFDRESGIRYSPASELHESFIQSERIINSKVSSNFTIDIWIKRYIGELILKKSWKSADSYPKEEYYDERIDDFSLTFEDWQFLAELVPTHISAFSSLRDTLALKTILKRIHDSEEISLDLFTPVADVTDLRDESGYKKFPDNGQNLSKDELLLLLDSSIWEEKDTLGYLFYAFDRYGLYYSDLPEFGEIKDRFERLESRSELVGAYLRKADSFFSDKSNDDKINYDLLERCQNLRSDLITFLIETEFSQLAEKKEWRSIPETSRIEIIRDVLTFCIKSGIISNFKDIMQSKYSSKPYFMELGETNQPTWELLKMFLEMGSTDLKLIASITENKIDSHDFSFNEQIWLMSFFPPSNLKTHAVLIHPFRGDNDENKHMDNYEFSERLLVLTGFSKGEIHPLLAQRILNIEGENAVNKIISSLHQCDMRHRLISQIVLLADSRQLRNKLYFDWMKFSPPEKDVIDGSRSIYHPKQQYGRSSSAPSSDGTYTFSQRKFSQSDCDATTIAEHDDVTTRRFPFRTVPFTPQEVDFVSTRHMQHCFPSDKMYDNFRHIGDYESRGNVLQRSIGEMLYDVQDKLIDQSQSFSERHTLLLAHCPNKTVVRDVHLERMLRAELQNQDIELRNKVENANTLLELFASSEFVQQYAVQTLELSLKLDPSPFFDANDAIDFLLQYLSEASLARNHYLAFIENTCVITYEQFQRISELKLTQELETKQGEKYYHISLLNQLSSNLSRTEKRKVVLWLLKLYKDKPDFINNQETRLNGSLDSLPSIFVKLTETERNEYISHFLLGPEGVLDITQANRDVLSLAEQDRKLFIEKIASELIPEDSPKFNLFRKIFITVFENADPVKASQTISNLINRSIAYSLNGEKIAVEEALSTALCSMGVAGKKVAQSLAEQDWIPKSYRKALLYSQENADRVSTSALFMMAEQTGLTNSDSQVQLLKIIKPLGSASNKQAALVEVKINDSFIAEKLNQPVGSTIELVGKFKRPSAQKEGNLSHDLNLLQNVLSVLQSEGIGSELPQGFAKQIETAISRELEFAQEVTFNEKLQSQIKDIKTIGGYSLQIPQIVYADNDIVFETKADGVSLRSLIDSKAQDQAKTVDINVIKQNVFAVLTDQLMRTGEIHADLHPANVFVDVENRKISLIDLGMNVQLEKEKVILIRRMLFALISGNSSSLVEALTALGWKLSDSSLNLDKVFIKDVRNDIRSAIASGFNSAGVSNETISKTKVVKNIEALFKLTQDSETPPPEEIALLIFATSKITPYLDSLNFRSLSKILFQTMFRIRKSL